MAEIQNQMEIFESIKASGDIPGIENWSYRELLPLLRQTIEIEAASAGVKNNPPRFFGRNALGLHQDKYTKLTGWLKGRPMSPQEMFLVVKTLQGIRTGTIKLKKGPAWPGSTTVASEPKVQTSSEVPAATVEQRHASKPVHDLSGLRRSLLNHLIGTINSTLGMLTEAKLTPDKVYDSDRMYLVSAMKKICQAAGIEANFREEENNAGSPVTTKDLRNIGINSSLKDI